MLELSEHGREAHTKLVDAGRIELTQLVDVAQPPNEEAVVVLRRLAVSLLADMPRDGGAAPRVPSG